MKEKYIDESYGFWYEFGRHPDGQGMDIVSSDGRVDTGPVSPSVAEILIEEHNRVQQRLVDTARAFAETNPEAFTQFWYKT